MPSPSGSGISSSMSPTPSVSGVGMASQTTREKQEVNFVREGNNIKILLKQTSKRGSSNLRSSKTVKPKNNVKAVSGLDEMSEGSSRASTNSNLTVLVVPDNNEVSDKKSSATVLSAKTTATSRNLNLSVDKPMSDTVLKEISLSEASTANLKKTLGNKKVSASSKMTVVNTKEQHNASLKKSKSGKMITAAGKAPTPKRPLNAQTGKTVTDTKKRPGAPVEKSKPQPKNQVGTLSKKKVMNIKRHIASAKKASSETKTQVDTANKKALQNNAGQCSTDVKKILSPTEKDVSKSGKHLGVLSEKSLSHVKQSVTSAETVVTVSAKPMRVSDKITYSETENLSSSHKEKTSLLIEKQLGVSDEKTEAHTAKQSYTTSEKASSGAIENTSSGTKNQSSSLEKPFSDTGEEMSTSSGGEVLSNEEQSSAISDEGLNTEDQSSAPIEKSFDNEKDHEVASEKTLLSTTPLSSNNEKKLGVGKFSNDSADISLSVEEKVTSCPGEALAPVGKKSVKSHKETMQNSGDLSFAESEKPSVETRKTGSFASEKNKDNVADCSVLNISGENKSSEKDSVCDSVTKSEKGILLPTNIRELSHIKINPLHDVKSEKSVFSLPSEKIKSEVELTSSKSCKMTASNVKVEKMAEVKLTSSKSIDDLSCKMTASSVKVEKMAVVVDDLGDCPVTESNVSQCTILSSRIPTCQLEVSSEEAMLLAKSVVPSSKHDETVVSGKSSPSLQSSVSANLVSSVTTSNVTTSTNVVSSVKRPCISVLSPVELNSVSVNGISHSNVSQTVGENVHTSNSSSEAPTSTSVITSGLSSPLGSLNQQAKTVAPTCIVYPIFANKTAESPTNENSASSSSDKRNPCQINSLSLTSTSTVSVTYTSVTSTDACKTAGQTSQTTGSVTPNSSATTTTKSVHSSQIVPHAGEIPTAVVVPSKILTGKNRTLGGSHVGSTQESSSSRKSDPGSSAVDASHGIVILNLSTSVRHQDMKLLAETCGSVHSLGRPVNILGKLAGIVL